MRPLVPRFRFVVTLVTLLGLAAACTAGRDEERDSAPAAEETAEAAAESTAGTVTSGRDTGTRTGAPAPDTLPLVSDHSYPTTSNAVVLQVSVDDRGLALPLFTVYGDLEAVARTDEGWRTGTVTDFQIQDLLDEADGVGLLGDQLELRGPDPDAPPDITVGVAADGIDVLHEFDLSQIERPPALRVLLSRWALSNPLGLDDPYVPSAWITCVRAATDDVEPTCRVVDRQATADDRPLLPHEPDAAPLLP